MRFFKAPDGCLFPGSIVPSACSRCAYLATFLEGPGISSSASPSKRAFISGCAKIWVTTAFKRATMATGVAFGVTPVCAICQTGRTAHEQGVAIRGRLGHRIGFDDGVAAGFVFHHHRLPQSPAQGLGNGAGQLIVRAPSNAASPSRGMRPTPAPWSQGFMRQILVLKPAANDPPAP
jgi:hypothetical protein